MRFRILTIATAAIISFFLIKEQKLNFQQVEVMVVDKLDKGEKELLGFEFLGVVKYIEIKKGAIDSKFGDFILVRMAKDSKNKLIFKL